MRYRMFAVSVNSASASRQVPTKIAEKPGPTPGIIVPVSEMAPTPPRRIFDFRFAIALLLLAPAALFAWRTVDGLAARRVLRTDLAELGHVRFGVLNADRWVEKILPILDGKIDALDLTAESSASLRPTVEKALYRLLDQVKEQMSSEARA